MKDRMHLQLREDEEIMKKLPTIHYKNCSFLLSMHTHFRYNTNYRHTCTEKLKTIKVAEGSPL
jgi:hypothetical protein